MQVQQNRSIFKVIVNKIHYFNLDHKNRTVTSDRTVICDFFQALHVLIYNQSGKVLIHLDIFSILYWYIHIIHLQGSKGSLLIIITFYGLWWFYVLTHFKRGNRGRNLLNIDHYLLGVIGKWKVQLSRKITALKKRLLRHPWPKWRGVKVD